MDALRVGLVLPYLKAGGTERQASYIMEALSARGHKPLVIVSERAGALADDFQEVVSLDVPFGRMSLPRSILRLATCVRRQKLDMLVSRAWNTNLTAVAAARLSGVPSVVFLSGTLGPRRRWSPRTMLQRWSLMAADAVISVSEGAAEACRKAYELPSRHIDVVHNGVDVEGVRTMAQAGRSDVGEVDPGTVRFAFVGRLIHRKGLDVLIDAIGRLRDESSPNQGRIRLDIVGVGEKERELREQVASRRLTNQVRFHGERRNPFPWIAASDVFVLPSRGEGFPNVLLEAMALSRPVVAADCASGPREILVHGQNGLLVPVGDVDALASALRQLLADRDLRWRLGGHAAQTVVRDFTVDMRTRQVVEVLLRVRRRTVKVQQPNV